MNFTARYRFISLSSVSYRSVPDMKNFSHLALSLVIKERSFLNIFEHEKKIDLESDMTIGRQLSTNLSLPNRRLPAQS